MKFPQASLFTFWQFTRLLAFAFVAVTTPALADEYSDVSQLIRAGSFPQALIKADQFLATRPRDPQMRFLKGMIQQDSGKQADALLTFTSLTEDYPELPEPYNNLAVLYAAQNQYDKARAALEMAVRTNPNYAVAHENLGDIYAMLASQAWSRSLALGAASAGVTPKLALIRQAIGNKPVATTTTIPKGTTP